MNPEAEIVLDRFTYRPYQWPLIEAIMVKDIKRALCIWPRRSGKDIVCYNIAIRFCLRSPIVVGSSSNSFDFLFALFSLWCS